MSQLSALLCMGVKRNPIAVNVNFECNIAINVKVFVTQIKMVFYVAMLLTQQSIDIIKLKMYYLLFLLC